MIRLLQTQRENEGENWGKVEWKNAGFEVNIFSSSMVLHGDRWPCAAALLAHRSPSIEVQQAVRGSCGLAGGARVCLSMAYSCNAPEHFNKTTNSQLSGPSL